MVLFHLISLRSYEKKKKKKKKCSFSDLGMSEVESQVSWAVMNVISLPFLNGREKKIKNLRQ